MATPCGSYLKAIRERFSYSATWLPNAKVELGDVGIFDGEYFKKQTSLRELEITFDSRRSSASVDFKHSSKSGLTIHAKSSADLTAGAAIPLGNATIKVAFSRAGAFLFHASGCVVHEIADIGRLGQQLLRLVKRGEWESSFSVVLNVVKSKSATILIANSRHSTLDLVACNR